MLPSSKVVPCATEVALSQASLLCMNPTNGWCGTTHLSHSRSPRLRAVGSRHRAPPLTDGCGFLGKLFTLWWCKLAQWSFLRKPHGDWPPCSSCFCECMLSLIVVSLHKRCLPGSFQSLAFHQGSRLLEHIVPEQGDVLI
jgi:hypothetical protein